MRINERDVRYEVVELRWARSKAKNTENKNETQRCLRGNVHEFPLQFPDLVEALCALDLRLKPSNVLGGL